MREKILFYYTSNKRTVSLETVMFSLKNEGYSIHFLTHCQKGDIHKYLEQKGIKTQGISPRGKNRLFAFIWRVKSLVSYCRKYQINVVFSHLQQANIIAIFAQYFSEAKFIIFRHHFKFVQGIKGENLKTNKNEVIADKLINRLARMIIVPSSGVYNGMLKHESVRESKLSIIPYYYDFSEYRYVSQEAINEIRFQYSTQLLIIMCARLTSFKRHIVAFSVFEKLIKQQYDLKVLVMDEGEEKDNLLSFVEEKALQKHIFFLGYQQNIIDYLAGADILVHPSVTEASNSTVKEAGLVGTPSVVCQGVGDFDEYIISGQNGYLISIENTASELEALLRQVYADKTTLSQWGGNIKSDIVDRFGSVNNKTMEEYVNLLN